MDNEILWSKLQRRLQYSDEEIATLRGDERWRKMVEDTPEFVSHRIVVDVIESHGCYAKHRVGDRFVMDANGGLITKDAPSKVCVYALAPLVMQVAAIYERLTAKLPLDGLLFDRAHCLDVGHGCGGWGQILMKCSVVGPESES